MNFQLAFTKRPELNAINAINSSKLIGISWFSFFYFNLIWLLADKTLFVQFYFQQFQFCLKKNDLVFTFTSHFPFVKCHCQFFSSYNSYSCLRPLGWRGITKIDFCNEKKIDLRNIPKSRPTRPHSLNVFIRFWKHIINIKTVFVSNWLHLSMCVDIYSYL